MRALAFVLVVGVFARHGLANAIAEHSTLSPAAWFYVLGGAWEVALCACLAWAIIGYRASLWRSLGLAACAIGAIEGAQMSACRLAITDIRAVPAGANLCDFATGLPVGAVLFTLYLLGISYAIGASFRNRG